MIAHLSGQLAVRALRRGAHIEQFLGATDPSGPPGVGYVVVIPVLGRLTVTLYEMAEYDDGEVRSLDDLRSLRDGKVGGEGRDLGVRDDPRAAMELAETVTGATRDRWGTIYTANEAYYQWIDAGRPPLR